MQLLKDPAAIAAARDKAIANQNKYGGISSDQVRSGAVPRSPAPPSPSRDWGRDSSRDEERRGGGHVDAFSSSARSAPPSGRPHHAAAPAAAPSHHAHSSSQPNFANFDEDDDFEDTNAATAGPKSFVPRIVMSAKPGSNASVPSSPAPLAPPPGSAGHSRRNTASGTSGDIFADFATSTTVAKPAADLFGAAPVSADPFAAPPAAASKAATGTDDLFGDFAAPAASAAPAKPSVDPLDLYNAAPAHPGIGAGARMGVGAGGGMSPGPAMMTGGMGQMGGMGGMNQMGAMGMGQMGGAGMNPQMGGAGPGMGMGMNQMGGMQMGGMGGMNQMGGMTQMGGMAQMGGMGSPAPAFPKRTPAPPADPFNTSSFGSQPSPPPKPGHGHKKNSSSGDVLSDLTSGMMGMGVGKKQGTGTPMKAGGKGGASLLDF